jgi:predicted nucleotidyltransferase
MTADEQAELVSQSRRLLSAVAGLRLALLYGSFANGKMRPGSDVDIAVLFDRSLDARQRMKLTEHLEDSLARTVDLADLFSLHGTILQQILCKGQVLVNNDPMALAVLIRQMIYNQADVMPIVNRVLQERQERFAYG